jgi:hypothetical protein
MNLISRNLILSPLFFLILISLSLVKPVLGSVGHHEKFHYDLKPKESICFSQDIAQETLFSVIVSTEDENRKTLEFTMIDPNGKSLRTEKGKHVIKFLSATKISGFYKFCVKSMDPRPIKMFVHMVLDAGMDYMEGVMDDANLQGLGEIISISMKTDHIKRMAETLSAMENENFNMSDTVINTMPYFSGGVVIVFLVVIFLQTKYLKHFFMTKKLV